MTTKTDSDSAAGFSLIEAVIGVAVLTVGALGTASLFVAGMRSVSTSPAELMASQKAQEAIEGVFSARDSRKVTWAQLRNAAQGGIFLNDDRPMHTPGADGIVNTADDGEIEQVVLPGPDQTIGTQDDQIESLHSMKRSIRIIDLSPDLREVTVTISYQTGTATRTHRLTTYISAYS
jgi:hypothetical protein